MFAFAFAMASCSLPVALFFVHFEFQSFSIFHCYQVGKQTDKRQIFAQYKFVTCRTEKKNESTGVLMWNVNFPPLSNENSEHTHTVKECKYHLI